MKGLRLNKILLEMRELHSKKLDLEFRQSKAISYTLKTYCAERIPQLQRQLKVLYREYRELMK